MLFNKIVLNSFIPKVLGVIFFFGIVIRFFHFSQSRPIILISGSFLAIIFLIRGYKSRNIGSPNRKMRGLFRFSGLGLAFIITGIQFKLLLFPDAMSMLLAGLIAIGGVFILIFQINKSLPIISDFYSYFPRYWLHITFFIGILVTGTPTKAIIELYYRDNPELKGIRLNILNHEDNSAYWKEYHEYLEQNPNAD